MKRQRNTAQLKKKGRNSQDQINKDEINNLPEKIQNNYSQDALENRMEKTQETCNSYYNH